jgi:hypothetical protein
MQNVQTLYAKTSADSTSGTTETRLLSPANHYNGSLGPPQYNKGDIYRITAWGTFTASGTNQTGQWRLYLNNNGTISSGGGTPIADSSSVNISSAGNNYEWFFLALVTLQGTGASANAYCDALLEQYYTLSSSSYQLNFNCGKGQFTIDTTILTNLFELTATRTAGSGTITLNQCSIEYLQSP